MQYVNLVKDIYLQTKHILAIVLDGDRQDALAIQLRSLLTPEKIQAMQEFVEGLEEKGIKDYLEVN